MGSSAGAAPHGWTPVPLTRLHRERHDFYDLAEACPRTLCHLDVWPANLIQRDDGTFVLFDWSFCGDGALGEDVANLIPDAVFDLLVPASMLDDLAPAVEEAYLAGVGESGWDGDERWIRLGLRAARGEVPLARGRVAPRCGSRRCRRVRGRGR